MNEARVTPSVDSLSSLGQEGEVRSGRGSRLRRLWADLFWGETSVTSSDLSLYRRLAMQLHFDLPRDQARRLVVVATPVPSPSAAAACTALACCLAEDLLRSVLLVDATPRDPEISRSMKAEGQTGLVDLLADPTLTLASAATPTTREHLFLLPAGRVERHPAVGDRDVVAPLLEKTSPAYDFVVLSTGSILDNPLSLTLAPLVGAVLLLAVEGETRAEDLDTAAHSLASSGDANVKLVLATPVRVSR